MPIRGAKNPFPKKTKMTNSGIFSHGTKGGSQKMDPKPSCGAGAKRAYTEAMRNINNKNGAS